MLIASRLEQRRKEFFLTQDDLANFVGVRVETLDNWEHGFSNPRKSNLQALAKALQTTIDYLEGNTDLTTDYSLGKGTCVTCGKSLPLGVAKCPECRWGKWSTSFLNSEVLATRRKRSHSVNLISLDREKAVATFMSVTSYGSRFYDTTLDMCTCPDFEERQAPCKHIFRLADELGIFKPEEFAPGEDDYTMHFEVSYKQDDTSPQEQSIDEDLEKSETIIEAISDTKGNSRISNIFLKILKLLLSCGMCFFAIMCIVGTISRANIAPRELIAPISMCLLGIIVAVSAKSLKLQGSILKWLLYGTFVPVVSWFDVLSARNKKHFWQNLFICVIGVLLWLIFFVNIIEPQKTSLNSEKEFIGTQNEQR